MFSVAAGSACLKGAAPSDFDIEAVFLFHFTQFVDWPQAAFPAVDAPFTIGVVGPDPFSASLSGIVQGEKVGRHPIVVREVRDAAAELKCQILYVSREGEGLLDFRQIRSAPILTVGESESFFKSGGIVQFFIDRRRVRLRINLEGARAHSLGISAKLLRVAEVTDWGRNRPDFRGITRGPSVSPGSLAEYRPLDLLLLRSRGPEFRMVGVKKILAYN
jgi:hypothetical protein